MTSLRDEMLDQIEWQWFRDASREGHLPGGVVLEGF